MAANYKTELDGYTGLVPSISLDQVTSIDPEALESLAQTVLTEYDRKRVVKMIMPAIPVTKLEEKVILDLLSDVRMRSLYQGSLALFVRHAVGALVRAWAGRGWPGPMAKLDLEYEDMLRRKSYEAGRLTDLLEMYHHYSDGLEAAVDQYDFEHIIQFFRMIESDILSAPSESSRERILKATKQSPGVRRALSFLMLGGVGEEDLSRWLEMLG